VRDLALDPSVATVQVPAGVTNQVLPDNDWQYYRFSIPANAPTNWTITFSQQVGNVAMWIRDGVPPGQGSLNGPSANSNSSVIDWAFDNKNQGPYDMGYGTPGSYTLSTPPLRPGSTCFVGIRSNTSATFSVSSTTGGGTIGTIPSLDFYTGSINTTIPANTSALYKIPVPADATRLKWTATHGNQVDVRLEQGTLPSTTGSQHWTSGGGTNVPFNASLAAGNWPWQPNQTYYLRLVNNSGLPAPVSLTMNGQNPQTEYPLVALLPVTGLSSTGATLNGTVTPNGTQTTVYFDYGPDASYGSSVGVSISPNNDSVAHPAAFTLAGLAPGATYHYRLRAINPIASANSPDGTFVTLTPLQQWQLNYFGAIGAGGNGGDNATPDHDGIPNLLKYGLVIPPGSSGANLMPLPQLQTYTDGTRLAVLFTRDPSRSDVTITVEAASSPAGPWTALATSAGGAVFSGPGFVGETLVSGGLKTVEVRDTIVMTESPRRFMRIKVAH
jgi:hypothetical protein